MIGYGTIFDSIAFINSKSTILFLQVTLELEFKD